MKRAIITLCGCILVFAGCKEKGPPIDFGNVIVADTTYTVSPVPSVTPHNVLAEEFTGQSCPNCPDAHELLDGIQISNPGRVNVIAYYFYGSPQTTPPATHIYDFRDSTANKIAGTIYSGAPLGGIPSGGIDRVPVSGELTLSSSSWTDAVNQRMNIVDSVNLDVVSTYSSTDSVATIKATTTYVKPMSTQQNLSIAIVEDSMIDIQDKTGGPIPQYLFKNVLRAMVSSVPYGDPVASSMAMKPAGTVNVRTYTYKLKAGWVPKHCRVVAFVHYSNSQPTKDVLQSTQVKLAP